VLSLQSPQKQGIPLPVPAVNLVKIEGLHRGRNGLIYANGKQLHTTRN
jgi:hypothetical protein